MRFCLHWKEPDDAMIVNFGRDPGFTNLQTIRHMFNLYGEIVPSVIGLYQLYALLVLENYGYTRIHYED